MGKKGAEAPDYGPLAAASEKSAQIMADLGYGQLDFAREQYNEAKPFLSEVAGLQAQAQRQQMDQAQDYYNFQRDTYRPLEAGLAESTRNFNTAAYRDQLATQASADVGLAFGTQKAMNERTMASMGVNPNSGRFQGLARGTQIAQSAQRAAAMTGTRNQVEQLGYARSLDAVGIGRNLSGASLGAYGGATGAGTAAGNSAQSAGQNYMGNMAIGSGTIATGQQMRINGLSNVLNAQTTAYVNSNDSLLGDIGGIMGAGASVMRAWPSDRRLKENIKLVDQDEATGLNLYEFSYIGHPDVRFIGVMADEVEKVRPDAVTEVGGYKAVFYDRIGIVFREVA